MNAPKHLTLRSIPERLARALKAEAHRRGTSLNQTAKELLQRGLGLDDEVPYDNGLAALAGTWSEAELRDFERATACFEEVDEELWA
ncbi:MAG TPA: hypothetical protein VGQ83_18645 [Polyangia bacterium]|jgi:plasmid stability protein